uniref:Protein HTATIP2 n=1 Tax=Arion vulgaris TaxID=1028688 RepID=A0A0B7A4T7_9EUPU
MDSGDTHDMEQAKSLSRSAFVMGYTGAVGKELVNELNKTKTFKKVILIGRRVVPLDVGPEFEQRVIDFEKLDEHKDAFKDLDAGFCCLGSYRAKVGVEGFLRTDRDYVLMSAQIAKDQGCDHFSIVSTMGSNKDSYFLYPKIKGEVEDNLSKMNFDRLSIYRPGFLITDHREEKRTLEKIVKVLMTPIIYFGPTLMSIPVETVAKAMVNNVVKPFAIKEIYENKAIHQMAKEC